MKRRFLQWLFEKYVKHGIYIHTENFVSLLNHSSFVGKAKLHWLSLRTKWRYRKYRKSVGSIVAIRSAMEQMDKMISWNLDHAKPDIQCGKGCSNCCYFPVTITDDEALALVQYIKSNNIQFPFDRAHIQATHKMSLELPREMRACIFLDTKSGECRVYEARPLVCRSHLSLTDPKYCEVNNSYEKKKMNYHIAAVEVMTMGVWNNNVIGDLPAMVLKNLG